MITTYREVLDRLSKVKGFEPEGRPLTEKVLEELESETSPFYIVRAPTGYGKTVLSLTLAYHSLSDASKYDRVIHVLPRRSIIEDVDSIAKKVVGFSKTKMMGSSEEFMHLFPLNITTIDTFIWDMIKLNTKKIPSITKRREYGYDYLTQASILTSFVVFDEAHFVLDDPLMKGVFLSIVKFLVKNRVPVLFLTATMPIGYVELFQRFYKKKSEPFDIDESDPFYKREMKKSFEVKLCEGDPLDHVVEGKRNIVIVNRVERAAEIYLKAKSEGRFKNILLMHGRMTPKHRRRNLEKLHGWRNEKEYLFVTTQVVEAGVDVSSDVMVTDMAPINSLIQRFGRVARYGESEGVITVITDVEEWPYGKELLNKTKKLLKEVSQGFHPRIPETYQNMLNEVHGKTHNRVMMGMRRDYNDIVRRALHDPFYRSTEVISDIRNRMASSHQCFLREFSIPLQVYEESILVTPAKAFELWSNKKIKVEGTSRRMGTIGDFYDLAYEIAAGEDEVSVIYVSDYDDEMGII